MWTALAKELLLFAKEVGTALALETLRSIRRRANPKAAAEQIIKEEFLERSYRS
jgi:hypothetical protein